MTTQLHVAYWLVHSSETALLHVLNSVYLYSASDNKKAMFDTLNHLETLFDISIAVSSSMQSHHISSLIYLSIYLSIYLVRLVIYFASATQEKCPPLTNALATLSQKACGTANAVSPSCKHL